MSQYYRNHPDEPISHDCVTPSFQTKSSRNMKAKSHIATIFIAGDLWKIQDACRRFCLSGLCVTLTPTSFVFTGGQEDGAIIGLINYPRFPSTPEDISKSAKQLAINLMSECCQRSCTIVCGDVSEYLENKDIRIPR